MAGFGISGVEPSGSAIKVGKAYETRTVPDHHYPAGL
jgi:hypothetical protein